MLSHLHRFHGHGSLRYVYRHGSIIRGKTFQIRYIENPHRVHSRFAVIVSKKVYKSAVKRNRIRRRVYEIIRGELPVMRPNIDVVLTVLEKEVLTMPFDQLRDQLRDLLVKEHLIS